MKYFLFESSFEERPSKSLHWGAFVLIFLLIGTLVWAATITTLYVKDKINEADSSPFPSSVGPGVIDIIHFNDVYQIEGVDGKANGGVARIAAIVKDYQKLNPQTIVTCGGDILSPSLMSTAFKGEQMISTLNMMGLQYTCVGNHELDFGFEVFVTRAKESKFTWVNSNLLYRGNAILNGTVENVLININGVKVGIFGLTYNLTSTDIDSAKDVVYVNYLDTAKTQIKTLKARNATVIFAITHLSYAEDCELSKLPGLSMILGGHDHSMMINTQCGGAPYIKATSDWRNFWHIHIDEASTNSRHITYQNYPVHSGMPEDPKVKELVDMYMANLTAQFEIVVGSTLVDLDCSKVRIEETNIGNFITDFMKTRAKTDLAIIQGGVIRTNSIIPKGNLTKAQIFSILPFSNILVSVKINGKVLKSVMELSVSVLDKWFGGFLQISGFAYNYSSSRPAGNRVLYMTYPNGTMIKDDDQLTLAITDYLIIGGDGYTMLSDLPVIIPVHEGALLTSIFMDVIQAQKQISPKKEGRITRTP